MIINLSLFQIQKKNNSSITTIKGNGSPFKMDSEGVEIFKISYDDGDHFENIDPEKIYSLFITKGSIVYENKNYEMGTFIKLENESSFNFKAIDKLEVFKVSSPKKTKLFNLLRTFI